jgi:hypothetical protein
MQHRTVRIFVPLFLAFYFWFGFGRWVTFKPEIYPIAAWGMFQRLDKTYPDYDLRIQRLGGRELDPPQSAREATGVPLDGQARLVLNGYVWSVKLELGDLATRYRDFIDRQIVGPDASYELLAWERHARRSERDEETVTAYGPFETSADLPAPTPGARFDFGDGKQKFTLDDRKRGDERPVKRRKSGR